MSIQLIINYLSVVTAKASNCSDCNVSSKYYSALLNSIFTINYKTPTFSCCPFEKVSEHFHHFSNEALALQSNFLNSSLLFIQKVSNFASICT